MGGSKQRLREWVVEVYFATGCGNDDAIQSAARKFRDASVNDTKFVFAMLSTHRDTTFRYLIDAVSVTNAMTKTEELMRVYGELDLFDCSDLVTLRRAPRSS